MACLDNDDGLRKMKIENVESQQMCPFMQKAENAEVIMRYCEVCTVV